MIIFALVIRVGLSRYLLLQTDDTGPFLLEEPLVLLPCGIVKSVAYGQLFSQGSGRVWQICSGEIGNERLMAISISASGFHMPCRIALHCIRQKVDSQLIGLPLCQEVGHTARSRQRIAWPKQADVSVVFVVSVVSQKSGCGGVCGPRGRTVRVLRRCDVQARCAVKKKKEKKKN